MLEKILLPTLNKSNVIRVNVQFNVGATGVDTVIGRAAHIRFLDLPIFAIMFVELYARYFE